MTNWKVKRYLLKELLSHPLYHLRFRLMSDEEKENENQRLREQVALKRKEWEELGESENYNNDERNKQREMFDLIQQELDESRENREKIQQEWDELHKRREKLRQEWDELRKKREKAKPRPKKPKRRPPK